MKRGYYKGILPILVILCSVLAGIGLGAQEAHATNGLAAHWTFDAGAGTSAADSSGNANTGTLRNGTAWVTGNIGNFAVEFDGSNDLIEVSDATSLRTGNFTIVGWVYPDSVTGFKTLLTKKFDNNRQSIEIYLDGDDFVCNILDDDGSTQYTATYSNIAQANKWQSWACSYNPTDKVVRTYVNNVAGGTVTATGNTGIPFTAEKVWIGSTLFDGSFLSFMDGKIDDLRWYNYTLTAAEIQSVTAVTVPITMNMRTGSSTPEAVGVSFTLTGNGCLTTTHDGSPATQSFVCNPNQTLTFATPADAATSRFRFSDNSTSKSIVACTTLGSTCSTTTYSDITRQFGVTTIASGVDSSQFILVTHQHMGTSQPKGITGTGAGTKIWTDQGSTFALPTTKLPATNNLYVANKGSDSVSVYNTVSHSLVANITVGDQPGEVGIYPSGNKAYVPNSGSDTVSVINTSTNTASSTINVGTKPIAIEVNTSTNKIYVANYDSDNISVIDGSTGTVTATISVGDKPNGVAINTSTNRIYVTNFQSNTTSVINGATDAVIATVNVGLSPVGIDVDETNNKIYVANSNDDTVSVIDGTNNTVTATISVGAVPFDVIVSEATDRAYVANGNGDSVSIINTSTNTVVTTINVGVTPFAITINPNNYRVYVSNSGSSNSVSVIDGSCNCLVTSFSVGTTPNGLAVNFDAPVTDTERFATYGSRSWTQNDDTARTVTYQHEFNEQFRIDEAHSGVIFAPMPDATFTATVTTANSTALPATTFTNDDSQDDKSVLSSRYWVKNGTQTFGAVTWRGLTVLPTGATCSVTSYGNCDVTVYSKHVGYGPPYHHFRVGTDGLTTDIDNISFDQNAATLTFRATASGVKDTIVEFLGTDYGAVNRVTIDGTDDSSANWAISVIDSTTSILTINDVAMSEHEFVVYFSTASVGGGGGGGGVVIPTPGGTTVGEAFHLKITRPVFTVAPGTSDTRDLIVQWSGATKMVITKMEFASDASWFSLPQPLPKVAIMQAGDTSLTTLLPLTVSVPDGVQGVEKTITARITATTGTATETVEFPIQIVFTSQGNIGLYAIGGLLGAIVIAAVIRQAKK